MDPETRKTEKEEKQRWLQTYKLIVTDQNRLNLRLA